MSASSIKKRLAMMEKTALNAERCFQLAEAFIMAGGILPCELRPEDERSILINVRLILWGLDRWPIPIPADLEPCYEKGFSRWLGVVERFPESYPEPVEEMLEKVQARIEELADLLAEEDEYYEEFC